MAAITGLALAAWAWAGSGVAHAAPRYCADDGERVLTASLYPYLPDVGDVYWRLAQDFEAGCPGLHLKIVLNPDYYGAHGILTDHADVYEVDSIFAADMAARHKVQPIPPSLAAGVAQSFPFAEASARVAGTKIGIPHWLCANFLFIRRDLGTPPPTREALVAWFRGKPPYDRLLLDLAGPENLGEMDLSVLLARWGSVSAALAHLPDPTAQAQVARDLGQLLSAEVPDTGRDPRFDLATGLYARLMARRDGGAYVGYSESLHAVLEESANGCRPGACVTSRDIAVARMPFGDRVGPSVAWVDLLMIDRRAAGRTARDAAALIRFMMASQTFRMLLIPAPGDAPRYLLPGPRALYADPALLRAAPLYAGFGPIIEHAVAPTGIGLEAALQGAAMGVDRDLAADVRR